MSVCGMKLMRVDIPDEESLFCNLPKNHEGRHWWTSEFQKIPPADGLQAQIAALADGLRARDAGIRELGQQIRLYQEALSNNLSEQYNLQATHWAVESKRLAERLSALESKLEPKVPITATEINIAARAADEGIRLKNIILALPDCFSELPAKVYEQFQLNVTQATHTKALTGKQRRSKKR